MSRHTLPARRIGVAALGVAALSVFIAAPALATWTNSRSGAGGSAALSFPTSTGAAPTKPTTSTTSSASVVVQWAAVNYSGTSGAAPGYVVKRYKGGSLDTVAGNCTGTVAALTCTDTVSAAAAYSYTVTPKNNNWIGTESTKSGVVTYAPVVAPAAPDSVTLTNGLGTGNAFVNNTNKTSVNFDVALPATSTSADTVHFSISGGTTVIPVPTQAGTVGSGTLHFNGNDLTALSDGAITVTAWVTNASGTSGNTTLTRTKDVVLPTPTTNAPTIASNKQTGTITGNLGTASGDNTTATVSGTKNGGALTLGSLTYPTAGTWSVSWSGTSNNDQVVITLTQTDTAGNSGQAQRSFTI